MDKSIPIQEVLENHRGERHIIALHDSPDPDAIAAAYAHKLISAEYGIETSIFYKGRVTHHQNLPLMKLLGIELQKYTEDEMLAGYDGAVFIDSQGMTSEGILTALESAGIPVLIVVDHREAQDRISSEFSDIRRTGATSTIYAGYLESGLVELDKSRREHVNMATALFYGILRDTYNFITAQAEDLASAAFLSQYRDSEFLEQIMSQSRTKYVMDIIRRALGNRESQENFTVAGIGYLRAEDREAISQAAEFLLTEENVHTALVYGIIREGNQSETLVGTMRTSKITLDPKEFLSEIFGSSIDGDYNPAENLSAGSFAIPIGFLAGDSGDQLQDLKWQVYDAQVKQKVFSRIGVTPEQRESFSILANNSAGLKPLSTSS